HEGGGNSSCFSAVRQPAWPLAAYAQQGERMRRIGVLLPAAPEDAEFQSWVGAFLRGLARNRGGSPDAMYGSELGGLNSTPKKLANMRPNWWRLYRTPSWRLATPRSDPCCD